MKVLLSLICFKVAKTHISYFQFTDFIRSFFNPFSVNFTKWSNTLEEFVDNLPTNCLSVFDHFVGLALKGLKLSATA